MWLQLRLYLLVGLMFAILYGIFVGIGYYLQITGLYFYLFMIGIAAGIVLIQYVIGPKIVEWSMRIKYVSDQEYPRLHQIVLDLAEKAGLPNKPKLLQIDDVMLQGNAAPQLPIADSLEEVERTHIVRVLRDVGWVIEGKQGAAARLGLHPNTLRSRMQKLDIKKPGLTA